MSKITKTQIKNLDVQTLLTAADWLFDANRRFEMCENGGRMSKNKAEYLRALSSSRRHCVDLILTLAECASGRRECADEIDLITCPRCDSCSWPVIENYGDEYSILCRGCAGEYHMGLDAIEYIKQKNKEVK